MSLANKTQSPKNWRERPSRRIFEKLKIEKAKEFFARFLNFLKNKLPKNLTKSSPRPTSAPLAPLAPPPRPAQTSDNFFSNIFQKIIFMAKTLRYKARYHRRRLGWNKIIGYGIAGILFCILIGGIFGVAALAWFSRDLPDPDKLLDRQVAQSTKIYDRTGEHVLYEIYSDQKRTMIELSDIPEYVQHATIVAEDRGFYEHHGFDWKGFIRSMWRNITRGTRVGGSTITQQLVKNAILSPEKTYTRKLRELALSIQIERKFSKDQILKMYFNEIPYGSTSYGIQSAAQTFFGKDAKNLDLAEAALLASLPKLPTYYSPHGSHTDDLLERQQYILDSMAEEEYITEEEAEAAKKVDVLSRIVAKKESITAPHFVMYVKEILTEKYGEKVVEQGGLKVYTSLDFDKQKFAEEAVAENMEKNSTKYNAWNAALVAIDPKTGQILAMVGSKDYFAEPEPEGCDPGKNCKFEPNVNVALRLRQPGSSFKPIVYAAAFQKGFTPETTLFDLITTFKTDTKDYIPHNYDDAEHGPVSMRSALAGSLNIPAVKTLYLAGIDNVLNLAQAMGYTTLNDRSRFGLSLVLGGGEVRLLEHVAAFGVFAADGILHDTSPILKIEDAKGQLLEEWEEDKGKEVISRQTARQIQSVMSDDAARSYIFGSGGPLTLPGRPVGAKTGTTNDWRDGWTMGYTPSLVAGVWAGNNDNKEMKRGADGVYVAAPIWNAFMKKALKDTPVENFTPPEPVETDKAILKGELGAETIIKVDKISGKLATENTPASTIIEKKFREVHTILFYVNKDDPNGPSPENPAADPQFANWEAPVAKWAEEQGYTIDNQDIPTGYDDVHLPEHKPSVSITSPTANATINSREPSASVTVSAPRGIISRVEYFIDDQRVGMSNVAPYTATLLIPNSISNGYHTLRATAYDDIDNFNSAEITFNLLAENLPPQITFSAPRNGSNFYASMFPLSVTADIDDISNIAEVSFYAKGAGNPELLKTYSSPEEATFSFRWSGTPSSGTYQLYAEVTNVSGATTRSKPISVTVL
ncbi:MAG: penicillin-binding protein [Patescibacteria group bacterium]